MADEKLEDLTEAVSLDPNDLVYAVVDPGGTPLDRKVKVSTLAASVPASASPGTFDVTTYGATGDGTTDDTAAIASAITALEGAGRGILYFPPGDYKTDPFSVGVPCVVAGAGAGEARNPRWVTRIKSASTTGVIVGVEVSGSTVRDLMIQCTGTPSAGAGVGSITAGGGEGNVYENLSIRNCWIGIDHTRGSEARFANIQVWDPHKWGIHIKNDDAPDGGDHAMVNIETITEAATPDAGIGLESGGGVKISNWKHNSNAGSLARNALYVKQGNTSVLTVTNCSWESMAEDACRIESSGTDSFGLVAIANIEINQFGATGAAFLINGASGTPITSVTIDNITAKSSAVAFPVFDVTHVTGLCIGSFVATGYTADFAFTTVVNFKRGEIPTGGTSLQYLGKASDDDGMLDWFDVPGGGGAALLSGAADPSSGDGNTGDFWINNTSRFIFGPKTPIIASYADEVNLLAPVWGAILDDASAPYVDFVGTNDLSVNSGSVTPNTATIVTGYSTAQVNGVLLAGHRPAGFSAKVDNWSLVVWIKPSGVMANGNLLWVGAPASDGYGIWLSQHHAGGTGLEFQGFFQGVGFVDSGVTLSAGSTYMLGLVRDSGTAQCYVDGAAVGSTSAATPAAPSDFTVVATATNAAIMAWAQVYDYALSPTEMAANFAAAAGGSGGWPAGYPVGPPAGGTTGQVLTKVSNADYDYDWA